MSTIRKALADHAKADDDRNQLSDPELLAQIEKRLKETDQKRIKQVFYDVILYDANNQAIDTQVFEITEPDLLFGTK